MKPRHDGIWGRLFAAYNKPKSIVKISLESDAQMTQNGDGQRTIIRLFAI